MGCKGLECVQHTHIDTQTYTRAYLHNIHAYNNITWKGSQSEAI